MDLSKLKTESIEDVFCNRMFKVNAKKLIHKSDKIYTIAKYHFTFGTNFLYITFNQRSKIYSVVGTRDFNLKSIDINNDGYIFKRTTELDEAKYYFTSLIKEFIEFYYVMY